ncbi:hypothetical protein [Pseudomonas syringae group genomosp. 3]|uniref:Uncharacterized protein n=1 Tax=Pseudomonas syringae pv. viburni TaxID=251703 RepID=A0A0Q0ENS4_9PSED|nr:hypothetical protein [Pseudomonas syringae group genomosp. 3]KPZ12532.1 Unknown protein sequence [Pseudomonas syringae pv. viburni]
MAQIALFHMNNTRLQKRHKASFFGGISEKPLKIKSILDPIF